MLGKTLALFASARGFGGDEFFRIRFTAEIAETAEKRGRDLS
jgi:hypothetical protein